MTGQNLNILEAIQIAKQAEQKAEAYYADAAQKTKHPVGRQLLERLAGFERHHYEKLVELERSLRDDGAFIEYEGMELRVDAPSEVRVAGDASAETAMGVITMAIDVEQQAEKRYLSLAEQTNDPRGHLMFERLAEEEHEHYRVLRNVYWSLNNQGIWAWPK